MIYKAFKSVANNLKKWFIGKIQHYNFLLAKGEALRRCAQENRKFYVISSSAIHWRVFSSLDVNRLKKMGVFKKELTFLEMTEKSAFVAYPKNK